MTVSSLPADDIRQMVRSILREVLPGATRVIPTREQIAMGSDEDLNRFVIRLLGLFDDPAKREAIRSGTIAFTLSNEVEAARVASTDTETLSGTISERKLLSLAKAGDTVAISADAVVTPLARDKARALNIVLIRRG